MDKTGIFFVNLSLEGLKFNDCDVYEASVNYQTCQVVIMKCQKSGILSLIRMSLLKRILHVIWS